MNEKQKNILFNIGLGIAAVIVLIILFKAAKKQIDIIIKNINLRKEINPNELQHTQDEFNAFAASLFGAMAGWSTNYNTIRSVIAKLKNKSEYNQLKLTFNKNYSDQIDTAFNSSFKGNLDDWFAKEITDATERAMLDSMLRAIGATL